MEKIFKFLYVNKKCFKHIAMEFSSLTIFTILIVLGWNIPKSWFSKACYITIFMGALSTFASICIRIYYLSKSKKSASSS